MCKNKRKSFVDLTDLTKVEIEEIFMIADKLSSGMYEGKPLSGKTILLFFPDSSLRTRVTFEKGIRDLGGNTILFPPEALDKKEDIRDVISYLENWADAIVVRHGSLDLVKKMAEYASIPIVNAMTKENHPCEILSDLYALSKIRDSYLEDKYLFVGEKGNIGHSWITAAEVMGFELTQCCPPGYEMEGVPVSHKLEEAVQGKDIICTDSYPEKDREAFREYQVTLAHMKKANPGAVLNPCPPFYRGCEVDAEVIESDYFVGYTFKKHLLEVQQAILCYLLCGEEIG